jgi:hypothetical protein
VWYFDQRRHVGDNPASIHFTEAEQTMFPNIEIAADRRFLEFNVGDWSMLLGGFMLAGLLVWLI